MQDFSLSQRLACVRHFTLTKVRASECGVNEDDNVRLPRRLSRMPGVIRCPAAAPARPSSWYTGQVRSAAHSTIQTALVAAAHVCDRTLQCDCAKHLNPAAVLVG